jgi:hypothetical protein
MLRRFSKTRIVPPRADDDVRIVVIVSQREMRLPTQIGLAPELWPLRSRMLSFENLPSGIFVDLVSSWFFSRERQFCIRFITRDEWLAASERRDGMSSSVTACCSMDGVVD